MELVIDIDECIYNRVSNNEAYVLSEVDDILIENAIANGTPLPKGHGRLIDANVLMDGLEDNYEICELVNATPSIIESEVNE